MTTGLRYSDCYLLNRVKNDGGERSVRGQSKSVKDQYLKLAERGFLTDLGGERYAITERGYEALVSFRV